MATAPVIDFQECGLLVKDFSKVSRETLQTVGKTILYAFKTYGFCYLKNYGMGEKVVNEYLSASRKFFLKSNEEKSKYKINPTLKFGWTKLDGERLNKNSGELHEVFTYTPLNDYAWPTVDGFETLSKEIFEKCNALGQRLLMILAQGLNIPNELFPDAHKLMGQNGNSTATRTVYYPSIKEDVKPGQTRLGEHIEYGTLAFTFQDNAGGLEMKTPEGEYIPVTPIEGLLSVHPGSMLQIWTADAVLGTPHRILIPEDEQQRNSDRVSIVFFALPDDDFPITCIDGSNKYEPTTVKEFVRAKFVEQYNV